VSQEEVYYGVQPLQVSWWMQGLCEFTVILDGQEVFKDAVRVRFKDGRVVVTDVLGESKEFKNCSITEVDVNSTRLVLSSF
jgi:predicted RNA-binding protein